MVSTIFFTLSFNIHNQSLERNEKLSIRESSKINLEDLNFFDIADFTNTSHIINVSRVIKANIYGYTTTNTKISVYNNGSKPIDAFNFTIPINEYEDTKYLKIYSSNDSDSAITKWEEIEKDNETIVFTVTIPKIEPNQFSTITIKMDHPNAITFNENTKLEEDAYPYSFNLSFIPRISLPITSYDIKWYVGKDDSGADQEIQFKNGAIQPTKDDFQGEREKTARGLFFKNVTGLTSINRSTLNTSENGNYNLTNLSNLDFIPVYSPHLAANFSSYLSFEYFQAAGIKVEFSSLITTVSVSEWGLVTTQHDVTIRNIGLQSGNALSSALGSTTFPSIDFLVPETVSKIGVKDAYGNMTPSVFPVADLGKKNVEIRPRVEIGQKDEYHLSFSYREKTSDIIKVIQGGKVQLMKAFSFDFNWTIRRFEFNLYLPYGSTFKLNTIVNTTERTALRETTANSRISKPELLSLFNKPGVQIIFEDFTPLSNQYVKIEFGTVLLYEIFAPLSISIFFLVLGVLYTVIRNLSFGLKARTIALEEIPLDLIKDFVKAYEEKTAIREQILRLDKKRKQKSIKKREYDNIRRTLGNRIERAERTIVNVSRKLAEEGQKYRIAMRSIEVAEASRGDILLNLESLERKKTQARIGKEAYAKLRLDYDKKLRSTNNDIDKVLIELRSLLTK